MRPFIISISGFFLFNLILVPVVSTANRNQTAKRFSARDSSYVFFLFDTSKTFATLTGLLSYKKRIDSDLWNFCQRQEQKSPDPQQTKFKNDSIRYFNQDLFTVLLFHYLTKAEKNMVNFHLLDYNLSYSHFVSLNERFQLFQSFPKEIREGAEGKKMIIKLNRYNNNLELSIKPFARLLLQDLSGNNVALSETFQKQYSYHLLVFGASWCTPCRHENLELKRLKRLFDSLKIQLTDISIDRDQAKWKKAVQEDDCPWDSFLLPGGLESALARKLNFASIPRNFLISTDYKIISEDTDMGNLLKKSFGISVAGR